MQKTEFLTGWRFAREGQPLRPVSIPHDAMLLEPRAPENPSGGCYTYENTFLLPPCGSAALLFEGIYPTAVDLPAASLTIPVADCP